MKRAGDAVSASEISAWLGCERIWAARYRWDAWPDKSDGSQFVTGTKFHSLCETYALTGKTPTTQGPIEEMFFAALEHLPPPMSHEVLETRKDFTYGGVPYQVKPDWATRSRVLDLKTSKDPKAYGLWGEGKYKDPQSVLYAYALLPEGGNVDHLYALKHRAVCVMEGDTTSKAPTQPKAWLSETHMPRERVERAFLDVVHPAGEKVFHLRNKHAKIDPLSLAPTGSKPDAKGDTHCEKYRGCPHRDRCFPKGYINFSGMGVEDMSTKFEILKKPAQIDPAAPTAQPAQPAPKFNPFAKKAAQEPAPETPAGAPETPAPETPAPAPAVETPVVETPVVETVETSAIETPVVETVEAPAPEAPAPEAPAPEAPAPEAPAPAREAPKCDTFDDAKGAWVVRYIDDSQKRIAQDIWSALETLKQYGVVTFSPF